MKAYSEIERQDKRLYDNPTEYTKTDRVNRVYCSNCHHTVDFWHNEDRVLCTWCNCYVYRTPELEEKYKKEEFKRKIGKMIK